MQSNGLSISERELVHEAREHPELRLVPGLLWAALRRRGIEPPPGASRLELADLLEAVADAA
jgi:hypothetical protein